MKRTQLIILSFTAIVIFILGAMAATANPVRVTIGNTEISFLPLIITSRAADAPPGVLYVYSSTDVTNGNAGGRENLGIFCYVDDPESHLCTYQEIMEAVNTMGIFYENPIEPAWMDHYIDSWNTDTCNGWSSDSPTEYGVTLEANATSLGLEKTCDQEFHVLCCKKIP